MIGDENWAGDADRRNFVRFYLEILDELRRTEVPVAGVVERSIGSEPVVLKAIFAVLKDQGKMTEADSRQLVGDMKAYGLNDSALLDVVLSPGEYTAPVPVSRQGEPNQWPEHWSETIEEYPDALTTYLKPSLASLPFRIEMFESIGDDFEPLVDLVMHTSRLLPTYGFPVGLDIVDKFAKVPAWMSRGVRGQHQIVLLRKAMESGDPSALAFAKRMLAAKGRDWLFRPTA
jgi:hypothetical protein